MDEINYKITNKARWLHDKKREYADYPAEAFSSIVTHKIELAKYFLAEIAAITRGDVPDESVLQALTSGDSEDWRDFTSALRFIESPETKKHEQLFSLFTDWLHTFPKRKKYLQPDDVRRKLLPMTDRYDPQTSPLEFDPEAADLWKEVLEEYRRLWEVEIKRDDSADYYFKENWRVFYQHIPEMESRKIISKTLYGYDWKITQQSLKELCRRTGYNSYTKIAEYMTNNGEAMSPGSLKQKSIYDNIPGDWEKIESIFF